MGKTLSVLSSLEVVLAKEDVFSLKMWVIWPWGRKNAEHCVSLLFCSGQQQCNMEQRTLSCSSSVQSQKRPFRGKQSRPPAGPLLKVSPEPRPRLKACLCSATSGYSRRGSRPTSAGWWRSCSRSSPMRRSTWTLALSAAGPAPWWGTLGTWRAPTTAGSSTPVIS